MRLERDPQIGDWWAMCCEEDLCELATDAAVEVLNELIDDLGTESIAGVWATEAEARADLQTEG